MMIALPQDLMLPEINIPGSEVSFLADPGSLTQGHLIYFYFPKGFDLER
jgi:hypothetical protein